MADENKFGTMPGAAPGGGGLRCEEWEALLADALDGLLPAGEAAAFRMHSETCANCGDLLKHAGQGREWLGYLHTEPEVPAGLIGRILDKTVGVGGMPLPVVAQASQGAGSLAMVTPWRRSFHETRLLMTVAMAFFSIALTLNLVGVKLGSLRLADLRPSQIGSTLSRQFFTARGSVVRYYDNLRFVYQLQSRMRELRRDVETQPQTPQTQQKQEPQKPAGKDGSATAAPERGMEIRAQQRSGDAGQRFGERPAFGVERSVPCAERSAQSAGKSRELLRAAKADTQATDVRVLVVTGNCISLGQFRTGLQRAVKTAGHEGRSLV